jgi:C-terminal processing protease CtpA/Prc
MRKIVQWLACMLLCTAASGQAASDSFRTDSLVKLCKVWSEVKFSDPRLMLREVDWDGALVRAIPKVREAQTNEQLAQAIGSMLAELSDPVTRVFRWDAPRSGFSPITLFRWDGDLLVVNIGPYLDSRADDPLFSIFEPQAAIAAELPKATSVVFDFRTQKAEAPGRILDLLNLVNEQVAVPAWRRVVRSGYTPASGPTAGGFYSALQVEVPPPLEGSGGEGGVPARYVFIVGEELPEQAAALWWSGHASIVAEAPLSEDQIARTRRIDLGDGWFAAVRVYETIVQGISADAVVAPGGKEDAAMTKVLALARDPAPLPARPAQRFAATAPIIPRDAPYADMGQPDLPYRLLGLFRLWSVIDRFYPFKDRIGDWAAVLAEFIPRFEQANDAEDYARAILEILARLEDGHTDAWGAPAIWNVIGARILPLELRSIEGRYIVTGKREGLPKDCPILIGDEIVSIDGELLEDRVRRLRKYYGASTEAARTDKVLFYAVRGPRDSVAELVVKGADETARTVKIARTRSPYIVREEEIWRVLDGNIGYVDLTRLTVEQIEEMFVAMNGTRAIIFDMRGYPNGTGLQIANRLNRNHATAGIIIHRPQLTVSDMNEARTSFSFEQSLQKTDQAIYKGPTVMLIDERALSLSEWTGLFFEAASGTKFVGTNTAGAVGDKTNLVLPGGIYASFTGQDIRHADDRPVQGIGLVPDVRVQPTIAGLRAGRDEVLERAMAYLQQSLAEATNGQGGSRSRPLTSGEQRLPFYW